jgi:hypothetical protein
VIGFSPKSDNLLWKYFGILDGGESKGSRITNTWSSGKGSKIDFSRHLGEDSLKSRMAAKLLGICYNENPL